MRPQLADKAVRRRRNPDRTRPARQKSRVSRAPVRKLRVFQPDLYVSADLQAGKLRYVRQTGGAIEETEETHEGGDALAEQAAAFAAAVAGRQRVELDGREGRRALALALTVGRLVRERLQRFE